MKVPKSTISAVEVECHLLTVGTAHRRRKREKEKEEKDDAREEDSRKNIDQRPFM